MLVIVKLKGWGLGVYLHSSCKQQSCIVIDVVSKTVQEKRLAENNIESDFESSGVLPRGIRRSWRPWDRTNRVGRSTGRLGSESGTSDRLELLIFLIILMILIILVIVVIKNLISAAKIMK